MKPIRRVTNVVDARKTQQRIIIWLECGHKVSITERQITATNIDVSAFTKQLLENGAGCPYCPDVVPPKEPYRDDIAT